MATIWRSALRCVSVLVTHCAKAQTRPSLPQERVCYWGGWGGSGVVNDVERGMTVAYMMNKMAPGIIGGPRSEALVRAAYAALG